MKVIRRILIVGLLLALTPGLAESVENVWSLVTSGHLAHSLTAGADSHPAGREHGCSGTFHLCSCCHAPVFSPAADPLRLAGFRAVDTLEPDDETAPAPVLRAPPYHPPRA